MVRATKGEVRHTAQDYGRGRWPEVGQMAFHLSCCKRSWKSDSSTCVLEGQVGMLNPNSGPSKRHRSQNERDGGIRKDEQEGSRPRKSGTRCTVLIE